MDVIRMVLSAMRVFRARIQSRLRSEKAPDSLQGSPKNQAAVKKAKLSRTTEHIAPNPPAKSLRRHKTRL